MKIGNKIIGNERFLIAEASLNHQGSLGIAFKMIEVAKQCGVDCIKFQTYVADQFCPKDSEYYQVFKQCEFERDDWFRIKEKCDKENIIFLSTPQNYSDLELLLEIGIPAIKIGSDDATNTSLIRKYSETGLPIILSGGMSLLEDIHAATEAAGDAEIALLVCTSLYPCPDEYANLGRIQTLKYEYPTLEIGFSDHTIGVESAMIASALGASIFECHFTLSNEMMGPDHAFSKNPEMLKWWVEAIQRGKLLMGSGEFELSKQEQENKHKYQRESGQEIRRA